MILITGSSNIGSHICYYLDKKKLNYIGIDNQLSQKKHNKQKKFIKVDISNSRELEIISKKKIKTVIHTAAFSYVVERNFKNKILHQ